jgi:hypothetical protein
MWRMILMTACVIAMTSVAHAKPPLCAKSQKAKWGCAWTKGIFNDSADAGDVITVEGRPELYNLDNAPDALERLIGQGSTYIVGDYLFCPYSPRVFKPSGDLRSYGCVEDFKNTTVIRMIDIQASPQELAKRVCALVDCSRPGFSDFGKDLEAK